MNINYIRVGDYFIPGLTLPEEIRPIGKWGRMHRDYLREHKPIQYNCLLLSGKLWTYLADLNEQAQDRNACRRRDPGGQVDGAVRICGQLHVV